MARKELNIILINILTNFKVDNLDEFVAKIHKKKTNNFINIIQTGQLKLRTGISRILDEAINANLKIAIATTTTYENIEAIIIHTLGEKYLNKFSVIAAGDIVNNKKPSGDIYKYTLDKMQLNANEVIAFEDSENGIKSANNANIYSVITINSYTKNQNFSGALVVLNNLGEPNKPFNIITGDKTKHTFVCIDYLQELYNKKINNVK